MSETSERQRGVIETWFEHIRTGNPELEGAALEVTSWTFCLPAEEQWRLILEMVRLAPDDECLGHVAAGPIEGMMGRFGELFIDRVERQAAADHKFARTLTNVWKHLMSDAVYARIQTLQARVADPLQLKPADG
jgi:hypothetical protein